MVRTVEAVGFVAAGDGVRATEAARAARDHALACGNRFVQGRVEWIEGLLASAADDPALAYRHIERGLLLLDELGMGQEVTVQADLLVGLAERRGEHDLAAQWRTFVAARGSGLARHDVLLVASTRNREGLRARSAGDLTLAHAAHLEALDGYAEAGVSRATAFTRSCLGFLTTEMGDAVAAEAHHAAALDAATAANEPTCLALALEGAAAGFGDGEADWAAHLLGAARTLWVDSDALETASHRTDVAALGERLQGALGPEAFALAFDRGATMGPTAALVAARTGTLPIT
jgi:hypothetical protein